MDLTSTPEWRRLLALGTPPPLRELFASDPDRARRYRFGCADLTVDLSKNWLTDDILRALVDVADASALSERRTAMFAGERINSTEDRAVLHVALRLPRASSLIVDGHDVVPDIHRVLDRMSAFADAVRDGTHLGHTGKPIEVVVNIGIGGSDLGPQMVVPALDAFAHPGITMHFVSNVDGHDIAPVLRRLRPEETLFVVVSKTFTTQETLANASVAREWFLAQGGQDVARHFVGVTTNLQAAAAFGIHNTFGFWDWVGGRYSLWSAVGLAVAIAVGAENFRMLLAGAHAMDQHFAQAPLETNLPAQLGLLDVWYRNFHGFSSRSVAPYHQGLKRLPAYLQQLEMESNGKRVDLSGEPLPYATSPVVWGEPGTNGQHAYFQMLHQGSDVIPVEFIAVKHPTHQHLDLHAKALANCLAQSAALMLGKTTEAALAEKAPTAPTASTGLGPLTLARHRSFPGNRPSTTLLIDRLTPRALGALIALYEHRVFTSGAIWGINSFDQWGVELGKALASDLLPRLVGAQDGAGLDASTAGLLAWLQRA